VFTAATRGVKPAKVARRTASVLYFGFDDAVHSRGEVKRIGLIAWIVVGLIAGILAKWVMPGPDPGGIITTVLIGAVGALLGGFVVNGLLGGPGVSGINLTSILVATLGAIILLAVYRLITRRAT
jgi:uncharacterized membrane protein YeaQ/YmgE (transglycosylase-associated protein family)